MNSEWREATVEELITEGVIAPPLDGNHGEIHPKAGDFVASGVPFIMASDLKDGQVDTTNCSFISAAQASSLRKGFAKKGDVLLSHKATIGRTAIVGEFDGDFLVLTPQVTYYRVLDSKNLNNRYLKYYFDSRPFQETLAAWSGSGSTRAYLGITAQRKLPIVLPPIELQREIASIMGGLDDRITLLRETNATLEAIAQALFKSWFVDFDPVRAKAEGRQPEGMDVATAALFPASLEESELGVVPRGWRVDRAEAWLSVLETGRRPKGGVSGIMDGVPSIGAESIIRIGEFDYSKTKYVSAEFFAKMKSGEILSHDVLLYKDGGKPGVFLPRVSMFGDGFPFDVCGINEHVFRVRLKNPFSQAFLYYWLWSDAVMHELKHRGGKAAIPGINQSDVKELKLLVPSEQTLNRFDEITKPLISKIFANAKKAQTLTQLRNTLLPRLISGQLRLPEAEPLVEEAAGV